MIDHPERITDRTPQTQGAYVLAVLFTLGYLAMLAGLMLIAIPESNKEVMLTLLGIMSAAQLAIIKYHFDSTKQAETMATANVARASRTDAVVQEIAKTAAPAQALAVAAARAPAPSEPVIPASIAPVASITAEAARAILIAKGMSAEDAGKLSDADAIKQATDGTIQTGTVNVQAQTATVNTGEPKP